MESAFTLLVSLLAAGCVASGCFLALFYMSKVNSPWVLRVMALGTGVLLSAVLLDFLPDAWQEAGSRAPWGVSLGVILMWIATVWVDKWFSRTSMMNETDPSLSFTRASATVLMISLSFHTFLEGFALSVAMHNWSFDSLMFAMAMLVHKIPEGILWAISVVTTFPSVLHDNIRRIYFAFLIPAICVVLGTVAGILLQPVIGDAITHFISTVIAGALLFICLTELVPAVRSHANQQFSLHNWFVGGILCMLVPLGIAALLGGG